MKERKEEGRTKDGGNTLKKELKKEHNVNFFL
jgi:hypothetical protein